MARGVEANAILLAVYRVNQRLHPQPVAHQKQLAVAIIPEAKSEHTAQSRDQLIDAPLAVAMQQNFRVGLGLKPVAGRFEKRAELAEVVNRAVEYHADGAVGRGHRLYAGSAQIEDREPSVTQDGAIKAGHAFGVRSPAGERTGHLVHDGLGALDVLKPGNSGDPAHGYFSVAFFRGLNSMDL
jgi:hypothetical protein